MTAWHYLFNTARGPATSSSIHTHGGDLGADRSAVGARTQGVHDVHAGSPNTQEQPLVSVVLPTYQEAGTILDVLEDVLNELPGAEVIVVDDDSPDDTWQIARNAFTDDDRVTVLRRTDEQGLSSAVLDGFHEARGRICICMDADGQHPADRLPDLVDEIEQGADLAVGSRHVDGGQIDGWSTSRSVISKTAGLLTHGIVASSRQVADPMSGFFAVDRRVFDDDLLDQTDPHGYKLLLELVTVVPDAEITEVPITFRAREAGTSKLTLDEQLRFLEHLVDLRCYESGLDEQLSTPLLVRSVEAAAIVAVALLLLNAGLIIGNVEGAVGAGLIAASGAMIVLGVQRLARSSSSWSDTNEVFTK